MSPLDTPAAGDKVIDCNVAILGAGPSGTAMAAHLGQLGVPDVVLLDRHDRCV